MSKLFSLAFTDLKAGLFRYELWCLVAWSEVRQRYRRSTLGPFWLTLSMSIMIAGLGIIYARLWHTSVQSYLPYLAVSLVFWSLISTLLLDSCQIFIASAGMIRQLCVPLSLYAYQMLFRNLIIFAHHLMIVLIVLPFCGILYGWKSLLALPGLLLLILNGLWLSLALGMLCARYRDVPQIMQSLVQILFFLTPIIWNAEQLDGYSFVLQLNPFYHMLELVRAPLLGQAPVLINWMVAGVLLLIGGIGTALIFGRYRSRIVFWI